MENIERFDNYVARLLVLLHKEYPKKIRVLDYDEQLEAWGEWSGPNPDYGKRDFLFDVLEQMRVSGYISYSPNSNRQQAINVVLTKIAVKRLRARPDSLHLQDEGKSRGEILADAVESGAMDVIRKLVSELMA